MITQRYGPLRGTAQWRGMRPVVAPFLQVFLAIWWAYMSDVACVRATDRAHLPSGRGCP
jgi:hypothetical protein